MPPPGIRVGARRAASPRAIHVIVLESSAQNKYESRDSRALGQGFSPSVSCAANDKLQVQREAPPAASYCYATFRGLMRWTSVLMARAASHRSTARCASSQNSAELPNAPRNLRGGPARRLRCLQAP